MAGFSLMGGLPFGVHVEMLHQGLSPSDNNNISCVEVDARLAADIADLEHVAMDLGTTLSWPPTTKSWAGCAGRCTGFRPGGIRPRHAESGPVVPPTTSVASGPTAATGNRVVSYLVPPQCTTRSWSARGPRRTRSALRRRAESAGVDALGAPTGEVVGTFPLCALIPAPPPNWETPAGGVGWFAEGPSPAVTLEFRTRPDAGVGGGASGRAPRRATAAAFACSSCRTYR